MKKREQLILGLCLGLACGVILHTAFSSSSHASAAIQTAVQPPPIAEPPAPARPRQTPANDCIVKSDGKTVLPSDGKTDLASDGKTTLPYDGKTVLPSDNKETLPPVGEGVGAQPQMIDPSHTGPPTEYQNSGNAGGNPLLAPPRQENLNGPVVSAETR